MQTSSRNVKQTTPCPCHRISRVPAETGAPKRGILTMGSGRGTMDRRYLIYAVALGGVIGLAGVVLWERLNRAQIPLSTYTDNSATDPTFRSAGDGALHLTRLFPTDVTAVPVFPWATSPLPVELGEK